MVIISIWDSNEKYRMTNAANADKYCSRMKIDHKQIVTDRHPR